MPAQGRKNVHGKTGVRFKAAYTTSKDKNMLRNVTSELIVYGKITVGGKVARQVQVNVEKLVTLAKRGDLHARRLAAARLREGIVNAKGENALTVLFSDLGPKFQARNGGYTRVLKLGNRRGDNAPVALVEFVD
ncbi:MAG TPA: 50S ribosomal protein L17 [Bacilli bacterium]|jgi:large subunit ribosomal protein L17|nr:50S ribosomal protein L17 [Bacilli bacterium]